MLFPVAPFTGFPGILLCRFPFLLPWFFVTTWTCDMHVPPCLSLVLSLCALNSCLVLNPPFHNSKIPLLKIGYIMTVMFGGGHEVDGNGVHGGTFGCI